jgi:hypothetical protein
MIVLTNVPTSVRTNLRTNVSTNEGTDKRTSERISKSQAPKASSVLESEVLGQRSRLGLGEELRLGDKAEWWRTESGRLKGRSQTVHNTNTNTNPYSDPYTQRESQTETLTLGWGKNKNDKKTEIRNEKKCDKDRPSFSLTTPFQSFFTDSEESQKGLLPFH